MKWPILQGEDWATRNWLAYVRPVRWVLHGVLAERSSSRSAVYIWVLRMPLYIPTDVIDLSWSERHGGGLQVYEVGERRTEEHLVAASQMARREYEKGSLATPPPGGADNVLMQEARAYALFLEGDAASAIEVLGRVERYEAHYGWEREMLDRAAWMRSHIHGGQRHETIARLDAWRQQTLSALKLNAR